MLPALAIIESACSDYIEDEARTFSNKGPLASLDKVQAFQTCLQPVLFQKLSVIDADIKTICSSVVRSHQDALNMKEKLELSIDT